MRECCPGEHHPDSADPPPLCIVWNSERGMYILSLTLLPQTVEEGCYRLILGEIIINN